jgi:hypothetical protein
VRRSLVALAAAAALGTAGAAVAHAFSGGGATLSLPELHGQVTWKPGARRADVPPGRPAVLAFLAPGCRDCLAELRFTLRQLPARLRPTVVEHTVHGRSLLLLVDERGNVRTGYTFPFAPAFVEGDLRTLAR